jgi:hypothetical protein
MRYACFTHRSLSQHGSRRRLRAIRLRGNWSFEMTIVVAIVLAALTVVLFRALT